MTACAICSNEIEPAPRYFTEQGEPRHMLCGLDEGLDPCAGLRSALREIEALAYQNGRPTTVIARLALKEKT